MIQKTIKNEFIVAFILLKIPPCEEVSTENTHPHIILEDSQELEEGRGCFGFPHQN